MTEFPWLASDTPKNWARCEIQDFCTVVRGGSPRPKGSPKYFGGNIPFVKISDVTASDGRVLRMTIDSVNEAGAKKSRLIEAGRIILSNSGTVCVPVFLGVDACIHDGFVAFDGLPKSIEQRFLFHFFKYIRPFILNKHKQGVTQVNLNTTIVSEIQIDIPPTNEQRCIVEKIEAQFDEIDKAVESLHTARATLGLYRQSLLKSAFEGRLTSDWRAKNADKLEAPETLLARIQTERDTRYKAALDDWQEALTQWRADGEKGKKPAKPKRPNTYPNDLTDLQIALPELPFGWRWAHLGWCSSGPAYGTSAKSNNTGEVPVIRMGNLQSGLIDWDNLAYTSDADEIEQYSLKPGDVLFNRTNSPELVGKTSIYKGERPALFAGYLVRVNQIEEIASGPYVTYFLNSPFASEHGKTVKTDGVNQSNINASKLQEYPFPFCPTAEQAEIVQVLDARLDAAARLEAEIDDALTRADALRQSILKKAFSGHLVPQDPDDEPASTLLTRIKADRAKSPKPKKRRTAHA